MGSAEDSATLFGRGQRVRAPIPGPYRTLCGQGYAAALVKTLAKVISDREETPFLHVSSENPTALALYRKLGFSLRRKLQLTVLECSQRRIATGINL
jgi:predicted GNAT family acetyltransferase